MKIAVVLFVLGAAISIASCLKCYDGVTLVEASAELTHSQRKWKGQGWESRGAVGVETTVCQMSRIRGRENAKASFLNIALRGSREMACYRSYRGDGTRTNPKEYCICATDGCNREMPANIEPFMSPIVNCTSVSGRTHQCGGKRLESSGDKCATYLSVGPQSFNRVDTCIKSLGDTGCIVQTIDPNDRRNTYRPKIPCEDNNIVYDTLCTNKPLE